MSEITTSIVKEDPEVAAYKLAMLKAAKEIADRPNLIPQLDAQGNPVVDDAGNPVMIHPGQHIVADMDPAQQASYIKSLQSAGYSIDPRTGQITGGGESSFQDQLDQGIGSMQDAQASLAGTAADREALEKAQDVAGRLGNYAGAVNASSAKGLAKLGEAERERDVALKRVMGEYKGFDDLYRQALNTGSNYSTLKGLHLNPLKDSLDNLGAGAGFKASAAQQNLMDSGLLATQLTGTAGDAAIKAAQDATGGGIGAYQSALKGVGDVQTANQGIADLMKTGIRGDSGVLDTLSSANTAASSKARELAGTAGDNLADRFSTTSSSLADTARNARQFATDAGTAAAGRVNTTQTASDLAIQNARQNVSDATSRLQSAGDFGQSYAEQGIGSLTGTTDRFSPDQISPFMNTFEDAAVQQALADIDEQRQSRQMGIDASAAAAGAFGGSRHGVQSSELDKSTLEQQGRTAAQMRQAGFEAAAQRAQQAFEQQQARAQQAAQLTGSLGAQGSQAALQAAQQQGALGLSSEELAARIAQQQGQLGLSADQFAAQTGLSAEQMAQAGAMDLGRMGLSSEQMAAQLGMSAEEFAARNAQQQAQTGLSAEELMARTGMNVQQLAQSGLLGAEQMGLAAYQNQGQQNMAAQELAAKLGLQGEQLYSSNVAQGNQMQFSADQFKAANAQSIASTGLSLQQLADQTGLSAQELAGKALGQYADTALKRTQQDLARAQQHLDLGQSINKDMLSSAQLLGQLGQSGAQMDIQRGVAQGELGNRFASLGDLEQQLGQREQGFLFDLGKQYQGFDQAKLEANRLNELIAANEPRNRINFLKETYMGSPNDSTQTTQSSATNPSSIQSMLGMGAGILSAAAGAKKAGLF